MDFIRSMQSPDREQQVLRADVRVLSDGTEFPLLLFPALEETGIVRHGFTTRLGGVSEGIFASLNLGFSRGDDPEAVSENFRRTAEALDIDPGGIVCSHQTHTTNVRVITEDDAGKGLTRPRDYNDVDGMITNVPGLTLATFFADCVPLFFVDPVHLAIGLSHSGWKGTVARMGARTLEAMAENYGTRPEEVICAVGPSICRSCYEVGGEVAEVFAREFAGHEEEILSVRGEGALYGHGGLTDPGLGENMTVVDAGGMPALRGGDRDLSVEGIGQAGTERKYSLDLWKANEIVLLEAGVIPERISVTDICTCCNSGLLFSHRASHGQRGNLGAFLGLLKKPIG